jgi:protein-disulfide isomerase
MSPSMRARDLAVALVLLAAVGGVAFLRARAVALPPVPPTPPPVPETIALGRTPDDPPARTRSGRVFASRDATRPPALGPEPAKVTVLAFADFTCPVCARSAGATRQIVEEWPGEVRLEFRAFAPAQHRYAEDVLVAGLAAHRQGRFWELHDVLFQHAAALDPASLPGYAREAGLDVAAFTRDSADPALRARVQAETQTATRLGVGATPTFFVNGRRLVGWASWQMFRRVVAEELAAVDTLLAKGVPLAAVHGERARVLASDADGFEAYRAAVLSPPS